MPGQESRRRTTPFRAAGRPARRTAPLREDALRAGPAAAPRAAAAAGRSGVPQPCGDAPDPFSFDPSFSGRNGASVAEHDAQPPFFEQPQPQPQPPPDTERRNRKKRYTPARARMTMTMAVCMIFSFDGCRTSEKRSEAGLPFSFAPHPALFLRRTRKREERIRGVPEP